jgi:short-subunit dehydrogenase
LNTGKKIVVVGATSAIAEHCARIWSQNNSLDLTLVGRDATRIEAIAADLRIRSPQSTIRVVQADFFDPKKIEATVSGIVEHIQIPIDIALIAHGSLPDQNSCQNDLEGCNHALMINGVSPVLYAEAFARHMAAANTGTLAVIGSVAGDRGRKSNYIYGAAKGLIERYVQGMQHRLAKSGFRLVLLKLGPTDTPMTAHLKADGTKLASVDVVARGIVDAVEQGKPVAYIPGKWRIIMWVIKNLPYFVFSKLDI